MSCLSTFGTLSPVAYHEFHYNRLGVAVHALMTGEVTRRRQGETGSAAKRVIPSRFNTYTAPSMPTRKSTGEPFTLANA